MLSTAITFHLQLQITDLIGDSQHETQNEMIIACKQSGSLFMNVTWSLDSRHLNWYIYIFFPGFILTNFAFYLSDIWISISDTNPSNQESRWFTMTPLVKDRDGLWRVAMASERSGLFGWTTSATIIRAASKTHKSNLNTIHHQNLMLESMERYNFNNKFPTWRNITLFRSIAMFCGTDIIQWNIPHTQTECEEYFAE